MECLIQDSIPSDLDSKWRPSEYKTEDLTFKREMSVSYFVKLQTILGTKSRLQIPVRVLQFIVSDGRQKQYNISQPGDVTLLVTLNIRKQEVTTGESNAYVIPVYFWVSTLELWWTEALGLYRTFVKNTAFSVMFICPREIPGDACTGILCKKATA
jgi:hypothetical protein